MPVIQFLEQFQAARGIATRRSHAEPQFGVVFGQRSHGQLFHQFVQAHAAANKFSLDKTSSYSRNRALPISG